MPSYSFSKTSTCAAQIRYRETLMKVRKRPQGGIHSHEYIPVWSFYVCVCIENQFCLRNVAISIQNTYQFRKGENTFTL